MGIMRLEHKRGLGGIILGSNQHTRYLKQYLDEITKDVSSNRPSPSPKLQGQEKGKEPAKETKGRPVKEERL